VPQKQCEARRRDGLPCTARAFGEEVFCTVHKGLVAEHGEESVRAGSYPKRKRHLPEVVTKTNTKPSLPLASLDPALVRPQLAAAAAEGLETIRAALLDAAKVNRKVWATITCKHCGRQGRYTVEVADTRSRVAAIELLLREGLGRPPQSEERQPKVPQTVLDLRGLRFADLEVLVAAHFIDLIREAGEDADGMLDRRIRSLGPEQRERVRSALDAAA
jgi:hypothetical protein